MLDYPFQAILMAEAGLRCQMNSGPFGNHLSFSILYLFTRQQLIGISRLNVIKMLRL